MMLIADGGSTKSNWCLVKGDGMPNDYFNTEGYNPYFADTQSIIKSLESSLPEELNKYQIKHIYYYGAGCSTPEKNRIVEIAMQNVFKNAKVFVGHDLLASARALLGNTTGFAAILGTGTNTCLYNGKNITLNIDSLGYFLGDEGSGSYIGRKLLRDYMRRFLPAELHKTFLDTFGLSNEDILDALYNKPLPNRFLASFAKFVNDNRHLDYCSNIVHEGFTSFFENLVSKYPEYRSYSFNCVGSVGFNFADILSSVAEKYGMSTGKIIRSPIDDLVQFHLDFPELLD